MPFLSGSLSFERFDVSEFTANGFGDDQMEALQRFAIDKVPHLASQEVHVGFGGGDHLLDQQFDLDKNIIGDAVHCSVRIDTDQIPSAVRKAWLQMEMAALAAQNESGRLTKNQRTEAKESVQARCEDEAASGKYRRMQHYPILWDLPAEQLYLAGTSNAVMGASTDLFERAFGVQLHRKSAGSIAQEWAKANEKFAELDDLRPANLVPNVHFGDLPWDNEYSDKPDFLGNEFLMWLWWQYATETDTITTSDSLDVTFMFAKTLSLECPLGENGKETISSESPVQLPEAKQAVQTGKLPRKAGLTLVAGGEQYDIVLQAETFGISGGKIQCEDDDNYSQDDRINSIRRMTEAIEGIFLTFVSRRVERELWAEDSQKMAQWLAAESSTLVDAA